jgi:hypothetical protein
MKKTNSIETLNVIHETKTIGSNTRSTRIFEFNSKKFKLVYHLEHGREGADLYIMNSDGEFKFVMDKYDFGHEFVSYVSNTIDKEKNINNLIKLVDSVVAKIW